MTDDIGASAGSPATERWEYLYFPVHQMRNRVLASTNYRWWTIFHRPARARLEESARAAVQGLLDELGGQGWELAGWLPIQVIGSAGGSEMIFKRRAATPAAASPLAGGDSSAREAAHGASGLSR